MLTELTKKLAVSIVAAGIGVGASAQYDAAQAFPALSQGYLGYYYQSYDPITETYALLTLETSAPYSPYWKGPSGAPRLGSNYAAPGWEDAPLEAVRTWRAPQSGIVSIAASGSTSIAFTTNATVDVGDDGVKLSIRRNRMPIWSAALPRTATSMAFPAVTIAVNAGDDIHFHVDRWGFAYNDWVTFLPNITLTPGPGYADTAVVHDSSTAFSSTTGPWYYLAVPQGQGGHFTPASPSPYLPMTYFPQTPPTASYWAWVSGGTTMWSRVFANEQHPETTHDSVRAWVAPSSGDVYLETVVPIAMSYVQNPPADGAVVSIHHNGQLVWTKVLQRTDTAGEMVKRRLHVKAGDSVRFRVSSGSSQVAYGDHVKLHVRLTQYPGSDSATAFSTAAANWIYRARSASGTYAAMTYNSSNSAWEYASGGGTARVFADRQVPASGWAAVRTWQAPIDCVAHVDTLSYARQTSGSVGGEDGVRIVVRRDNEVFLTETITNSDLTGVPVTVRVPMRAGQLLDVAVDDGGSGNVTGDDVTLAYCITPYRNGGPRRLDGPVIEVHASNGNLPPTFEASGPILWSWGTYKVDASIRLDSGGYLDIRDAVLQFENTYQRQFNLNWRGGRAATANVVGGGRLSSGSMYHSNFELNHGTWYCTDSILQFHYGVLPGDPYVTPMTAGSFRGTRVGRGQSCGELIMRGPGTSRLADSTFQVNLNCKLAGTPQSVLPLSLPVDRVVANTHLGNTGTLLPGALYDLHVENSMVTWWFFFPTDVDTNPPGTTPWTFQFRPSRRSAMLPNFAANDLEGGYSLPLLDGLSLTPTIVRVGECVQDFLDTQVKVWGAYFNGTNTNVVMTGQQTGAAPYDTSHIGEFMVFGGRVHFRASSATRLDALSGATTMEIGGNWSNAPATDVTMKRVKIGIPGGARGEINVDAGSVLRLEDCTLDNVDIWVKNGTVVNARSNLSPSVTVRQGVITPATPGLNDFEPIYRWDFTSSRLNWRNFDTNAAPWFQQGFPEPWSTTGSALVLKYPSIPSGGWTPPGGTPTSARPLFIPRIVAPASPLLGMNTAHCYLVMRVNPHLANTATPLRIVVSATDKEASWASWMLYERQFDISAATGWVTYVVDLNAGPGAAHPRLTPLSAATGWKPLSGRTDYLGIQFGTFAQNGYLNAGDWLEVDYVIVTDDFTPY